MKTSKILAGSVIGGVVLTAITGVIPNTPGGLLGASWYGYPLKWLIKQVLAPQYNPWKVLPVNLVADLIFWIVVVAIIMMLAGLTMKKTSAKKAKKSRR